MWRCDYLRSHSTKLAWQHFSCLRYVTDSISHDLFFFFSLMAPLSSYSWQSSGVFFSPQPKRRYRRAWWTTSVCSSLSVVAPCALPSLLSYRRLRQLKATSTTTDAAGPGADVLSHSNAHHDHRTKTAWTLLSFYSAKATRFSSTFEAVNNFTFNSDKVSSE